MRTRITAIITVLACFASSALGQASARLANDAEGYSFAVPKGLNGQASGEGFALANADKTILILVRSHAYANFAAFAADANLEKDGLELVGKPQEIEAGTTFRTVKRTAQGTAVIDTSVVFRPAGSGVVVVAMSDEANADAAFNLGVEIARSVTYQQPKASAADDRVRDILAGKHLLYLFTGSGYSERKDILLCSDGRFFQSTDMGGFTPGNVDGPSFAATGGKGGTWQIMGSGSRLVLRFAGGAVTSYTISARQASNEIGLNGQRFFVQGQNKCR